MLDRNNGLFITPAFILTLMIPLILLLVSCTAKIDKSKTLVRNGLLYKIGSDEPFTGVVTGISRSEDYRKGKFSFKKQYKDGLLEGRSFYYYPNDTIESIEPYSKGVLDGVVTRYYDNGQIKARLHFAGGYRGGTKGEMFWNKDGSRRNK